MDTFTMSAFDLRMADIEADAYRERRRNRSLAALSARIKELEAVVAKYAPVMESRVVYTCPRCNGAGLVPNLPDEFCPDDDIACPTCNGSGNVDDLVEQEVEVPEDESAS